MNDTSAAAAGPPLARQAAAPLIQGGACEALSRADAAALAEARLAVALARWPS